MPRTLKGKYQPRNPEKYNGNPTNIEYRSSWERTFMRWADLSESVKNWSSEEIAIPYFDPIQKKVRRYYPDFLIRYVDSDGLIITELVEIKPYAEVVGPPRNPKRRTESWMYAVQMYINNQAKWEAAKKFCEDQGWRWRIITEKDMNIERKEVKRKYHYNKRQRKTR